mmetsp:Transcript_695/g.2310  ORF Transcript_695/g.2310 Transcript_695/m.2310 type:complete len:187 (+) Transcript_695:165-725(+)
MSAVDVSSVQVLKNPAPFTEELQFEITYEVRETLSQDIEWKVIYVGSAEDQTHDQELDCVLLPADNPGQFKFQLTVDPPRSDLIPSQDLIGVTIVLLTCSYRDREFLRVGYYVNNEYTDAELQENPPATPIIEKVMRNIVGDQPRVTRFQHKFDFGDVNDMDDSKNGAEKDISRAEMAEGARNLSL